MPGGRLERIKPVLQMHNEGQFSCIVVVFVRYKIQRVGKNGIVDAKTLCGRGNVLVFHLWNGRRHSFHFLEMGLAHLVKVSLCLFGTSFYLTGLGLCPVTLTESLGLDDAVASGDFAVPAFVFQKHGVFGKHVWGGTRSLVCLFDRLNESAGLVVLHQAVYHRRSSSSIIGRSSTGFGVEARCCTRSDVRGGHGPFLFGNLIEVGLKVFANNVVVKGLVDSMV